MIVRLAQQDHRGVVSVSDQVQPGADAHAGRARAVGERDVVDRPDDDLAPVRVLHQVGKRHVVVLLAAQANELVRSRLLLEPRVERHLHVDVLEWRVAIGHDRKREGILAEVCFECRPQRRSVRIGGNLVDDLQKALERAGERGNIRVCPAREPSGPYSGAPSFSISHERSSSCTL